MPTVSPSPAKDTRAARRRRGTYGWCAAPALSRTLPVEAALETSRSCGRYVRETGSCRSPKAWPGQRLGQVAQCVCPRTALARRFSSRWWRTMQRLPAPGCNRQRWRRAFVGGVLCPEPVREDEDLSLHLPDPVRYPTGEVGAPGYSQVHREFVVNPARVRPTPQD